MSEFDSPEDVAEAQIAYAEYIHDNELAFKALVGRFERERGVAGSRHEYEQEWLNWLEVNSEQVGEDI